MVKRMNYNVNYRGQKNRQQHGAALVIGLVVLLMLTLLGVSSMNMTSLELRIASNTKNKNIVFQTADSANDAVFVRPMNSANGVNVQNFDPATPQVIPTAVAVNSGLATVNVNTVTTVTFQGQNQNVLQCGLEGFSADFSCLNYSIVSVSNDAGNSASQSTVTQGVQTIGPKLGL